MKREFPGGTSGEMGSVETYETSLGSSTIGYIYISMAGLIPCDRQE